MPRREVVAAVKSGCLVWNHEQGRLVCSALWFYLLGGAFLTCYLTLYLAAFALLGLTARSDASATGWFVWTAAMSICCVFLWVVQWQWFRPAFAARRAVRELARRAEENS
jgi:hypothetical protein